MLKSLLLLRNFKETQKFYHSKRISDRLIQPVCQDYQYCLNQVARFASTVVKTSHLSPIMSKFRLPEEIRPSLYDLSLFPDLKTGLFRGVVQITINVAKPSATISLHTKGLSITNVTLNNEEVNFRIDKSHELLEITKNDNFSIGTAQLFIEFDGDMKNRIVGLYTSKYKSGDEYTTIATSKFEPTYARQAFPCFDEPNMKAKYIVHLLKPKKQNYIALSNYPVAKTESYDAENDLVTFEETVSMSTYLTCFIVSDFTYTRTTFNNSGTDTELRVYASPGNLEKTKYAGEVAKKVIEYYIDYFGIPYPLPKLDMVAIPDFVSGAMEHWGLVTYRETALLYTNTTHSSSNKQRVATVIAHELAHSWFGNLVTMDWWNDLWLNEGFASYIEFKGTNAAEPSWEMLSQFQTSDLHPVLSFDASISSHPIVTKVENPDHITEIFDLISYNKGASILRMLENTVGSENFRKGVRNYLNKYRFGNAVTKNFLDEIQAVVGSSINIYEMMDTFTVQMGYPVLNVKYNPSTRNYTLSQKRFLKDPKMVYDHNSTTYGYKWTIPITYVTDQGKSEKPIFFPYNQTTVTITKPENATWLKFNYDQVGYYRVNYELSQWQHLFEIYHTLAVTDRTHLLEECFSLAAAGLLSYNIPLDLTKQLSNETAYAPWSVAASQLKQLLRRLKGTKHNDMLQNYVRQLVVNAYQGFTWNESAEDGHLRRLTRSEVLSLACHVNLAECLSEVKEKFDKWIEDPSQSLSPDLRAIVYKYGMTNADAETWNKMLEVYKQENDAQEKAKLMAGLVNVRNSSILLGLLELIKDDKLVRGQDYFVVLNTISANPMGTDLVWDYVRENWEYLVNRFTLNDRYLGTMVRTVTSQFSTQEKLSEMKEFFGKYPEAGAGAAARKTALENVQNNIIWLENYKSVIEKWIEKLNEN